MYDFEKNKICILNNDNKENEHVTLLKTKEILCPQIVNLDSIYKPEIVYITTLLHCLISIILSMDT